MDLFGYKIDEDKLPEHVAVIMDGNGRWAGKKNFERIKGHEKGYKVLKEIVEFNKNIGIKYLSFYSFSTENWQRPREEVSFLMQLAKNLVAEYTETLLKNDIRLMITGVQDNLSEDLLRLLQESISITSKCRSYTLNIVFNYGGRREIIDAARKLALDYKGGKIDLNELNEKSFSNYMYNPELPDVDLLIRTSGENRISNFLLWQSSYAEFWITRKYWPDFKPSDYCRAVSEYQQRKRRFGGLDAKGFKNQ